MKDLLLTGEYFLLRAFKTGPILGDTSCLRAMCGIVVVGSACVVKTCTRLIRGPSIDLVMSSASALLNTLPSAQPQIVPPDVLDAPAKSKIGVAGSVGAVGRTVSGWGGLSIYTSII